MLGLTAGAGARLCLLQGTRAAVAVNSRSLMLSQGEPIPLKRKPFDYLTHSFNWKYQFFYKTWARLGENSKIITVDGNIGSGKTEVAKKLAAEFGMLYMPDVDMSEQWIWTPYNVDLRKMRDIMPPGTEQIYFDVDEFYRTAKPGIKNNFSWRYIQWTYEARFFNYICAMEHVLSTGQGVVIDNSPWGQRSYVETYGDLGYIDKTYYDGLINLYENSICDLMRPHVMVYLDQSPAESKAKMVARGRPLETGAAVLNDDFLERIDHHKRNILEKKMKRYSEIVYLTEEARQNDWNYLVERIADMDLESEVPQLGGNEKFNEWWWKYEREAVDQRIRLVKKVDYHTQLFKYIPVFLDGDDHFITGRERQLLEKFLASHAILSRKGHPLWPFGVDYENWRVAPTHPVRCLQWHRKGFNPVKPLQDQWKRQMSKGVQGYPELA